MSEGSLKVISDGTIKFSSPDEFNDPFDCAPDIDVSKSLEHIEKNKELLKAAGKKRGLSPAKRIEHKNKMLKVIERAMVEDDYTKKIAAETGICCLSKNPLDLLMWAHYAEKHTGFVVEFCIPEEVECLESEVDKYLLQSLFPQEVDYSDIKPIINPLSSIYDNAQKQFLTKSDDWRYESEWRVIDYKRGNGIHSYNRISILKSVIAGIEMKDKEYGLLKDAVNNVNSELNIDVQLHRAEKVKGKFALMVPGRDELTSEKT